MCVCGHVVYVCGVCGVFVVCVVHIGGCSCVGVCVGVDCSGYTVREEVTDACSVQVGLEGFG